MPSHFKFELTPPPKTLKEEWQRTLTAPQDGMWEAFRGFATQWTLFRGDESVGYACVNDENQLIQFYIRPEYLAEGGAAFRQFLAQTGIPSAIVGTQNPVFLSLALHEMKAHSIHTYLFEDHVAVDLNEREGTLNACTPEDLDRIVAFCHYSIGAPIEWLTGYLGDLIEKGEVFAFEHNDQVIGTCEVRKSASNSNVADIGMIVSPDHRRQGYGTYLLHRARALAIQSGREPICSCEKDNLGSRKAIEKCGFRSMHQLLEVSF